MKDDKLRGCDELVRYKSQGFLYINKNKEISRWFWHF